MYEKRNAEIYRRRMNGETLRSIAECVGLRADWVGKIVLQEANKKAGGTFDITPKMIAAGKQAIMLADWTMSPMAAKAIAEAVLRAARQATIA